MMTTGNREDYLISILRLTEGDRKVKTTELAAFIGVSPASVTEMIKTLSSEGLVVYERYKGLTLSDEGMRLACRLRKKHHIIEQFLTGCLGIDHGQAHQEAHVMEHAISDDTSIRLCSMTGNQIDNDCAYCPAPCKHYTSGETNLVQLNKMAKNKCGRIVYIKTEDKDRIMKLNGIGLVPGRYVKIESILMDGGDRVVKIGDSLISLDYDLASAVFVDLN